MGKVGGIINFSGQVSGIAASIVTGYLVTALHSYAWVFGVAATYLAIGIGGYIFLLGKIELRRSRTETALTGPLRLMPGVIRSWAANRSHDGAFSPPESQTFRLPAYLGNITNVCIPFRCIARKFVLL